MCYLLILLICLLPKWMKLNRNLMKLKGVLNMPVWGWILIGIFVVLFFLLLFGLMKASGDYSRRQEEAEWKNRKKNDADDSGWF